MQKEQNDVDLFVFLKQLISYWTNTIFDATLNMFFCYPRETIMTVDLHMIFQVVLTLTQHIRAKVLGKYGLFLASNELDR